MENLWVRIPTIGGPLAVGTAISAENEGFISYPNPRHSHRDVAGWWPKSSLALPGGGTEAQGEEDPCAGGTSDPPQQHLKLRSSTQGHHRYRGGRARH